MSHNQGEAQVTITETSCSIQELCLQLTETIERMPDKDKRDYIQAARSLPPAKFRLEADPVKCLRCCSMNVVDAANKLTAYWKRRRLAFREKAFSTMEFVEDNNGALLNRDMSHLMSGCMAVMPNDTAGCPVFCEDASRQLETDPQTRCRAAFYVAHKLAENQLSQTDGITGISIVRQDEANYDQHSANCFQIITDTLPLKVKSWHIIDLTSRGNAREQFDSAFGKVLGTIPCTFHRYDEAQQNLSMLSMFGLAPQDLPRSIGGEWSYRHFLTETISNRNTSRRSEITARDKERRMMDCLCELLDEAAQKAGDNVQNYYLEAKNQAPAELWTNECNVHSFLVTTDFNCRLAASLLSRYWELRAETFAERQFSPLNQSSEDAMDRRDMNIVNSMFLVLLPCNRSGQPVLWIDPSRLSSRPSREAIKRSLFYFFSLLAEETASRQDPGAVILFHYTGYRANSNCTDINFLRRLVESMPIRIKAAHIVNKSDTSIPPEVTSSFATFAESVHQHISFDLQVIASRLTGAHSFELAHLPKAVGGGWGVEQFCQWQELRTRYEWKLPLGFARHTVPANFPAIRPCSPLADTTERRRRMNVLHTRRTRDRTRITADLLQEQTEELQVRKRKLTEEHRRLLELHQRAKAFLTASRHKAFRR